MNCPRCGRPLKGLNCECGFSFSRDKVCFIGSDAQVQSKTCVNYLKAELKRIADEEKRKEREFEKKISESEVKRVEEGQLHKQKSADDESTAQVYKRAQYVNDNRTEQSSGTEVKHNSVDLGLEDVQKRLEHTRDELLADLEKRKPTVLNRTGGNFQQNNAENKSGSARSSKGDKNGDNGRTKPKLIYVISAIVLLSSIIGFIFHNGVLFRKNALNPDGGGWGDSDGGRPSYTIEEINGGILGDTITFNSISDGDIGDEKNFVAVKVAGEDVSEWNANSIKVKDGETYTVRMFVHNNNPKGHDAVARDVKARFCLPEGYSKEQTIIGYLDSSNASPTSYWDGITFTSDKQFFVEYVAGSARFNNNEFDDKGLDDEIISSGTNLGYGSLNGRMPGCYEYSGVATIDIIVHEGTWGPQDRAAYTMDSPAAEPAFDSITDNPSIGDERNFVRIGEINPDQTDLIDSVELKKGKQYLVYIYIHNNASATYNDKEYNRKGVATNTRLSTDFPDTVNADETGIVQARIVSDNSNPNCVWDTAMVTTKEESISLKYVAGSAKIYNDWDANNTVLPSTLFSNEGALVGLNELNGVIPGCEEYHSIVTYVLEAE